MLSDNCLSANFMLILYTEAHVMTSSGMDFSLLIPIVFDVCFHHDCVMQLLQEMLARYR